MDDCSLNNGVLFLKIVSFDVAIELSKGGHGGLLVSLSCVEPRGLGDPHPELSVRCAYDNYAMSSGRTKIISPIGTQSTRMANK
jgi:hypothetical protein